MIPDTAWIIYLPVHLAAVPYSTGNGCSSSTAAMGGVDISGPRVSTTHHRPKRLLSAPQIDNNVGLLLRRLVVVAAILVVLLHHKSTTSSQTSEIGVTTAMEAALNAALKAHKKNIHTVDDHQSITSASNGSKPVLILHVGPPKTGSTTLQCTLESLRKELQEDGIAYIGRPECQGMHIDIKFKQEFRLFSAALVGNFDCQRKLIEMEEKLKKGEEREDNTTENIPALLPSCLDGFIQRLDAYRQDGTTVIFSDEAMSNRIARTWQYRPSLPYPWATLKAILESMGWDVRILIVHRPLYDYLPSVYDEQYKDGPNKRRLRQWFGGVGGEGEEMCPSQNGRAVPRPFDTNTKEITIARLLEQHQTLYPTPAQVYELFRDHDFAVILVDMMEVTASTTGKEFTFIQHIICNLLPGALHTCRALLNSDADTRIEGQHIEQNSKQLNPSAPLHYDFIAVEACQKGLFNGTIISRDEARRAIQYRQEHDLDLSPNDLPLLCPENETLHDILRASLDHERRLRIHQWSEEKESWHKERFWRTALEKKKFCTVDSIRVVQDEEWVDFFYYFRSMDTRYTTQQQRASSWWRGRMNNSDNLQHPHIGAYNYNKRGWGWIVDPSPRRLKPFNHRGALTKEFCSINVREGFEKIGTQGLRPSLEKVRRGIHKSIQQLDHNIAKNHSKILCMVYTAYTEKNKHASLRAIAETWGRRCDGFIAASNRTDHSIGAINLSHEGIEIYGNMWQKVRSMWAYAFDHYLDEFDYFYICGDDMYIAVENLKAYVEGPDVQRLLDGYLDPITKAYDVEKASGWLTNVTGRSRPLLLGQPTFFKGTPFASGGQGYVLNRAALELLGRKGLPYFRTNDISPKEDVFVGQFFARHGIYCATSVDEMGAWRFGPRVEEIFQRRFGYPIKAGLDSIAEKRIAFHLKPSRKGPTPLADVIHHFHAVLYDGCDANKTYKG